MESTGHPKSRRSFIGKTALGVSALTLSNSLIYAAVQSSKVHIGIVGGRFGATFQFHQHPDCIVEAVSDLIPQRREALMKVYNCSKSYESLELLLRDPKINAVFLATPAPDHVDHVILSLKAGKHVLCAVPAALTIKECYRLREAVKRSGLIYMMAETSYYRQNTISVRKFYQEGQFGNIFSAAAEYNHPELKSLWFENGKANWRQGPPPLHFPTAPLLLSRPPSGSFVPEPATPVRRLRVRACRSAGVHPHHHDPHHDHHDEFRRPDVGGTGRYKDRHRSGGWCS